MDLHNGKGSTPQARLEIFLEEFASLSPSRQVFIVEVLESFMRVEAQRKPLGLASANCDAENKIKKLVDWSRKQAPDRQALLLQMLENLAERLMEGPDDT